MSIATRINAIEEHIGNAYDKLEDLGIDLTNVNKNINNIAEMLDTVYEDYPKVTGQGTELTLNGTKAGKLTLDVKGNSTQETTTGSNLIGLNTTQCPVSLHTGDKIVARNTSSASFTLNLYTNLGDTTRNDFWSVASNATRVITVAHDTGAIAWNGNISDGLGWVNLGETIQPYEPYTGGIASPNPSYPQEIYSAGDDINLFDKTTITPNSRLQSNGSLFPDNNYFTTDYISVKANTTYKANTVFVNLYNRICFYNENKTLISANDGNDVDYFVTPAGTKFVRFGKANEQLNTFKLVE